MPPSALLLTPLSPAMNRPTPTTTPPVPRPLLTPVITLPLPPAPSIPLPHSSPTALPPAPPLAVPPGPLAAREASASGSPSQSMTPSPRLLTPSGRVSLPLAAFPMTEEAKLKIDRQLNRHHKKGLSMGASSFSSTQNSTLSSPPPATVTVPGRASSVA